MSTSHVQRCVALTQIDDATEVYLPLASSPAATPGGSEAGSKYASAAMSANEIAVDGSPTTFALLFATSMSSGDASSLCAAIATILSRRIFAVSLTAPAVIDPLRLPAA